MIFIYHGITKAASTIDIKGDTCSWLIKLKLDQWVFRWSVLQTLHLVPNHPETHIKNKSIFGKLDFIIALLLDACDVLVCVKAHVCLCPTMPRQLPPLCKSATQINLHFYDVSLLEGNTVLFSLILSFHHLFLFHISFLFQENKMR